MSETDQRLPREHREPIADGTDPTGRAGGLFRDAGGRESIDVSPLMRRAYMVGVVAAIVLLGLTWLVAYADQAAWYYDVSFLASLLGGAVLAWFLLKRA